MREIRIVDAASGLFALVAPEYGGMPVELGKKNRKILDADRYLLARAPMHAGGMPVLFPFPGRTNGDLYKIDAAPYRMPLHGLVKNSSFAVSAQSGSSVTLWTDSCGAWLHENYPFQFRLELTYSVDAGCFSATARVLNLSPEPMPHGLGWHPFFVASDKKSLRLRHHMKRKHDLDRNLDEPAPQYADLAQPLDDVLIDPGQCEFLLENPADGYSVHCAFDPGHNALVVCTTTDASVCVEPWCGLPDSANNRRFVHWVKPGCVSTHQISLRVETMPKIFEEE